LTDEARAGRGSYSPEARATAAWLVEQLKPAGYRVELQPIGDDQSNVIAQLGTSGPTVFVVAHYDHLGKQNGAIHPGANDNASGVAVALAVARSLAGTQHRVVFLFTGAEEEGLVGARAYVRSPMVPLAEIRAVFNLDMVGRNWFESTVNEPAKLAGVGLPGDPAIEQHAMAAAEAAGLTLISVEPSMLAIIGQSDRTDDWPFRDAGVFAVHFSTGLTDDYHRPNDTPDKLVPAQLVRTARFLRELVLRSAR
jgi:Zn-dependent M28 family amino/carboxypeptidase